MPPCLDFRSTASGHYYTPLFNKTKYYETTDQLKRRTRARSFSILAQNYILVFAEC
jgi:hypothetical protein